jgi:6-phosphogluconolactonase
MRADPGEPELRIVATADAAYALAAELVAQALAAAVERRGRADWATTGGSTAPGIYRELAAGPLRDRVPWDSVHVWWADDRFVPADHPLSNVQPFEQVLLAAAAHGGLSGSGEEGIDVSAGREPGVRLPASNVHPIRVADAIGESGGPELAAEWYDAELHAAAAVAGSGSLPMADGWPAFDLALVGIGPDGHLLSVFPGSSAWDANAWAIGIPAPTHVEPHVPRVTLHPRVLDVARALLIVSVGASKADMLGRVFGERVDVRELPAQAARRSGATWVLDAAAAAQLPT